MNNFKNSIRQHLGLVVAAIATCLVLGAVLILALTGAGSTSHAASASSSPTTTVAGPAAPAKGAKAKHPVRGAVTAISGDTWNVTVQGTGVTVKVTPQTKFGTKAAPLAATDFSVGNEVTVVGSRTGTTVTATRVTRTTARGAGPAPSSTVPSTPSAG